MKNSKSNSVLARFLNVSLTNSPKYSKLYIDEQTGKTLVSLPLNQRGKGVKKPYNVNPGKYSLCSLFCGKHPKYQ